MELLNVQNHRGNQPAYRPPVFHVRPLATGFAGRWPILILFSRSTNTKFSAPMTRGDTTHTTYFALDIYVACDVLLESTGGHNRRVARLTRSRAAKPQEDCLLTSFGSIDVGLTVPLAWFWDTGRFQGGVLSLRDPAPSEPGCPYR